MTDLAQLNRSGIRAILPHRQPFLFVERIVAYEPGRSIVGTRRISRNDRYLAACPDGVPTLPSAVLFESLLQLGALLVMAGLEAPGQIPVITKIERLLYRGAVRAGELVCLEAWIVRRVGQVGRMKGRARVGRCLIAHGTVQFALIPRSSLVRPRTAVENNVAGARS